MGLWTLWITAPSLRLLWPRRWTFPPKPYLPLPAWTLCRLRPRPSEMLTGRGHRAYVYRLSPCIGSRVMSPALPSHFRMSIKGGMLNQAEQSSTS